MKKLSGLSQLLLVSMLSTFIAFLTVWPIVFKLGWLVTDIFDGTKMSANDSFIVLLIIIATLFNCVLTLALYIYNISGSVDGKTLQAWKKNLGVKPDCERVNVLMSNGVVLWKVASHSLDWSLHINNPISEYMKK